MPNFAVDELYTTVENISGSPKFFGFLGAHGLRLAADEVITLPGNLVASLGAQHALRGTTRRFDALQAALANEQLRINQTPAPVYFDVADDRPRMLGIDNATLGVVDPSYNADQSESAELVPV